MALAVASGAGGAALRKFSSSRSAGRVASNPLAVTRVAVVAPPPTSRIPKPPPKPARMASASSLVSSDGDLPLATGANAKLHGALRRARASGAVLQGASAVAYSRMVEEVRAAAASNATPAASPAPARSRNVAAASPTTAPRKRPPPPPPLPPAKPRPATTTGEGVTGTMFSLLTGGRGARREDAGDGATGTGGRGVTNPLAAGLVVQPAARRGSRSVVISVADTKPLSAGTGSGGRSGGTATHVAAAVRALAADAGDLPPPPMTARPPATTRGGAADDGAESTSWAVNPLAPRSAAGGAGGSVGGGGSGGSSSGAGAHAHGAKPLHAAHATSTVAGLDSYRRNPLHTPSKR